MVHSLTHIHTMLFFLQLTHLFFISRTSLLRVTSSVPPADPRAGEVAMTTPGVMALVAAVRI